MRSVLPTDVPPFFVTIRPMDDSWGVLQQAQEADTGSQSERNAKVALVPPKPKELDSAARIVMSRAMFGTKSRSHLGSRWKRFAVGGAIWSRIASTVKTASMPPAAPSRCPVIDLVDET